MAAKDPANYPVALIGSYQVLHIPVSFETNGLGDLLLPTLPYRCTPRVLETVVVEDVEATDDATVTLKKSSTTLATATIAGGAQIGENDSDTTVTEEVFEETDQIKLTLAKTTAGGRALVALTVEVLPSH